MGTQATLSTLAAATGLDAVLLTAESRRMMPHLPPDLAIDAGTDSAAAYFLAPGPDAGRTVASDDPHVFEVAALGHMAWRRTPAVLPTLAQHPPDANKLRQIHIQVNGPPADVVDTGLQICLEGQSASFDDAWLHLQGDGVAGLSEPALRRFCATAGLSGAATLLPPWRRDGADPWLSFRQARTPDELIIINNDEVAPLVAGPGFRTIQPAANLRLEPTHILIGGCCAGDLSTLNHALECFQLRPPASGIHALLLPNSRSTAQAAQEAGLVDLAASLGTPIIQEANQLPVLPATTLTTPTCQAPYAFTAAPRTCIASAQAGRLTAPEAP